MMPGDVRMKREDRRHLGRRGTWLRPDVEIYLAAGGIPERRCDGRDRGSESTVRRGGRFGVVRGKRLCVFCAAPRGARAGYRMHTASLPAGGRTPWSWG